MPTKSETVFYNNIDGVVTSATIPVKSPIITETNPTVASRTVTVLTGTVFKNSTLSTTAIQLVELPFSTPSGQNTSRSSSTSSTGSSSPAFNSTVPACPKSTPASKFKFTSGDIAAAIVSCLVGGALIAGLVVWLFMSSRHKKQRSRGGFAKERHSSSNVNREKSLPTALTPAAGAGWEQHLPQSESDGTIRTSVKALFDQIELHVENFYRNAAVSISPEIQSQLTQVGSSHLPDSIVGLLPQTSTPTMLIKHCLAALIVSRITPETDTSASFLPADFVALPLAMGGTRTSANNKPGKLRKNCQNGNILFFFLFHFLFLREL
jgi:hypothetical protein